MREKSMCLVPLLGSSFIFFPFVLVLLLFASPCTVDFLDYNIAITTNHCLIQLEHNISYICILELRKCESGCEEIQCPSYLDVASHADEKLIRFLIGRSHSPLHSSPTLLHYPSDYSYNLLFFYLKWYHELKASNLRNQVFSFEFEHFYSRIGLVRFRGRQELFIFSGECGSLFLKYR